MKQQFTVNEHFTDEHGRPAGGNASAPGLCISWQNGPLGRGDDRREPNGAFVETVIQAAIDRLEFYESGQFRCEENARALGLLRGALADLETRTRRREAANVEGTHEGS